MCAVGLSAAKNDASSADKRSTGIRRLPSIDHAPSWQQSQHNRLPTRRSHKPKIWHDTRRGVEQCALAKTPPTPEAEHLNTRWESITMSVRPASFGERVERVGGAQLGGV
jgi:hypothetical protein